MAIVGHSVRALAQVTAVRTLPMAIKSFSQKPPAPPVPLVNVEVDEKSGIATVALNRRPVNSLNTALLQELGAAIKDLETNKARGMILTSASDNVFSAGLDLFEMYDTPRDKLAAFWSTLQNTWLTLYRTPFPTAAAINGHAPAGGCLLGLSCEYRVMVGPKFTIGLNESQLGIVAPPWFAICMRDVIGPRQTELALTSGRMFTTPEALKIGLIDSMVSNTDEAIADAKNFISRFAKIPSFARQRSKELSRQEAIRYMEENMIDDLKESVETISQPHIQKALQLSIAALKEAQTNKPKIKA